MATYNEALTAQLRAAHMASLRQRYLDLIEEARMKKEREDRAYFDDAKQAYVEKRKGIRSTPQKLSALGISGGQGDEELNSIVADYNETMEKLRRRRSDFLAEYQWTVDQQTRLMNNALNEYNAQIALQDFGSSGSSGGSKKSSSKSSSSKKSNAGAGSAGSSGGRESAESSMRVPETRDYLNNENLQPAPPRKRQSV